VPCLARLRNTRSALKSAGKVKNAFILTRIWHLGLRVWRGRLKSKAAKNIMMKIEFKKIKMAYGLIINIKGNHIRLCLSSKSPVEKKCDCYTIGRDLCMLWRGRFESKGAEYDVEDRV
jgi:hypothetical protein